MTSVKSGSPLVALFVALLLSSLVHKGERGPREGQWRPPERARGSDQRASLVRGGDRSVPPRTDPARGRDTTDLDTEEEARLEVKVVTFNQGRFDPPILEPFRFWPRGHTAVIIDGDVHSFETDWQCGKTETEYKTDNAWRGAWVQVLDVPKSDAQQLQADFDRSCGTGAFLLTGVCTSSAGRLLQNVLTDLEVTWAPMRLRRQLTKKRYVDQIYRWHREVWVDNFVRCVRGTRGDQAHAAGPYASRANLQRARDECRKRLGLSETDLPLPLESPAELGRSVSWNRPTEPRDDLGTGQRD